MASSLARLVSSNFLRVRPVGSFSRFFNTKGFQYDQPDSWDECILKCDDKHGSLVRDVIIDAFGPCRSPTTNLARLLNMAENRIGFGPCKLPRWRVVEDDKALYLLRIITGLKEEYVREFDSNRGFMSEKHEKDVEESVTKEFMSEKHEKAFEESVTKEFMSEKHEKAFEESVTKEFMSEKHEKAFEESVTKEFMSEKHEKAFEESVTKEFMSEKHEKDFEESATKEFMSGELEKDGKESLTKREFVPKKVTERLRDFTPLLKLITGDKIAPTEYYYHLMKNAKELDQFAESIEGGFQGTMDVSLSLGVSYNLANPQAIYIIIGLGGRYTDDPFGGYAIEIFLPDWFYKIEDAKMNATNGINITIPKNKDKSIQTMGGNIIFFQEKKIWKPTLWRPT